MIDGEMIVKALVAHKEWKVRLENAINTGQSDFKPAVVMTDNACEFGKWLYSLSDSEKASVDFNIVKNLHAEFHKVAAEILQLAVSGQRDEAIRKITFGGTYGLASSRLATALYDWKNKL